MGGWDSCLSCSEALLVTIGPQPQPLLAQQAASLRRPAARLACI